MPLLLGGGSLGFLALATAFKGLAIVTWPSLAGVGVALVYLLIQCGMRLYERRWKAALFALLKLSGLVLLTILVLGAVIFSSMFEPSEDHFADKLMIPENIEVAEPERGESAVNNLETNEPADPLQSAVRQALALPGGDQVEFAPEMPSLRRAATDHPQTLFDYLEASPDWHVFLEQGNRFAARRWSYGGEPRDTLHGYISEFSGDDRFQTRCLLCLDRKQWSRYRVQHVEEGSRSVTPKLTLGNDLHESRVMIECGGVWVEIFEQSSKLERRITKATLSALQSEFSEFEKEPEATLAKARAKSRQLAVQLAGTNRHPFRLLVGMQPGIYGVVYSLNPGEPGAVYLKAFELTQGTPLSSAQLAASSKTRMTWSTQAEERFGAKAGFTIYEGDWGKPYAARFEVWFKPDSTIPERKLAERIFKIEGWQR